MPVVGLVTLVSVQSPAVKAQELQLQGPDVSGSSAHSLGLVPLACAAKGRAGLPKPTWLCAKNKGRCDDSLAPAATLASTNIATQLVGVPMTPGTRQQWKVLGLVLHCVFSRGLWWLLGA